MRPLPNPGIHLMEDGVLALGMLGIPAFFPYQDSRPATDAQAPGFPPSQHTFSAYI